MLSNVNTILKLNLISRKYLSDKLFIAMLSNEAARRNTVKLSYEVYDDQSAKDANKCPVVVLHGLYGSKMNWHSMAKLMVSKLGRMVITVDARNHGNSPHFDEMNYHVMKDDLAVLLDTLQLRKVVLVGHSMGGRTSMYLALTEPSYVDRLIVVDISPISTPSQHYLDVYAKTMNNLKFPEGVSLSQIRKLADVALQTVIQEEDVRMFLLSNIIEKDKKVCWRFNVKAIHENIDSIVQYPQFTTTFMGPTLFIGGGASSYLRPEEEGAIKKLFPSARFQYIPDSRHFVHSHKPTEFLEVVTNYLNTNM